MLIDLGPDWGFKVCYEGTKIKSEICLDLLVKLKTTVLHI